MKHTAGLVIFSGLIYTVFKLYYLSTACIFGFIRSVMVNPCSSGVPNPEGPQIDIGGMDFLLCT